MGKGVPWEGIDNFAGRYIDMFRYELSMSSLTNGFILTVSFFGELGVHDSPIVKRLKRKNVHHSSNIFEAWLATVKVSWNFSYKNHGFHSVENLEPQVTTHFQGPLTSLVTWCLCCLYMLISKPSTQWPWKQHATLKNYTGEQRFFHVRQCVCIGGCQFAPGSQRADNAIHFDEGHFTKPSLHEKTHFYSL